VARPLTPRPQASGSDGAGFPSPKLMDLLMDTATDAGKRVEIPFTIYLPRP
jgi:hypothetical protein